jgi:hypothetical protein
LVIEWCANRLCVWERGTPFEDGSSSPFRAHTFSFGQLCTRSYQYLMIISIVVTSAAVRVIRSGLRDDGGRHCRVLSPRCGDYSGLKQGHTIRQQKCAERPRGRLETRCVNRREQKNIDISDPAEVLLGCKPFSRSLA